MKKIFIVSSILLTFSLIIGAALFAGDQDKSKPKTATAVQKVEAQEVKVSTDKCGQCPHKCLTVKAEENSTDKCDCDNCKLTKGSPECKARHAAGECKHGAEKTDQIDKQKK